MFPNTTEYVNRYYDEDFRRSNMSSRLLKNVFCTTLLPVRLVRTIVRVALPCCQKARDLALYFVPKFGIQTDNSVSLHLHHNTLPIVGLHSSQTDSNTHKSALYTPAHHGRGMPIPPLSPARLLTLQPEPQCHHGHQHKPARDYRPRNESRGGSLSHPRTRHRSGDFGAP